MKTYIVEVYVRGWLFRSEPMSADNAAAAAHDFKAANPLSRPTILEAA